MEAKYYLQDGANHQARAVLVFMQPYIDIEKSWDEERKRYCAKIEVARWENCREQGYVLSVKSKDYSKQLNIAFFEHRNSDSIHAVKWEQCTLNSPTIDTAKFPDDVYNTKFDTSFSVGYGKIVSMSEWIQNELEEFWTLTCQPAKDNEKKELTA